MAEAKLTSAGIRSVSEVVSLFEQLGLDSRCEGLRSNEVDAKALAYLIDARELRDLGMTALEEVKLLRHLGIDLKVREPQAQPSKPAQAARKNGRFEEALARKATAAPPSQGSPQDPSKPVFNEVSHRVALADAIVSRDPTVAAALLATGADPNPSDQSEEQVAPLALAVASGAPSIVALLVVAGAKPLAAKAIPPSVQDEVVRELATRQLKDMHLEKPYHYHDESDEWREARSMLQNARDAMSFVRAELRRSGRDRQKADGAVELAFLRPGRRDLVCGVVDAAELEAWRSTNAYAVLDARGARPDEGKGDAEPRQAPADGPLIEDAKPFWRQLQRLAGKGDLSGCRKLLSRVPRGLRLTEEHSHRKSLLHVVCAREPLWDFGAELLTRVPEENPEFARALTGQLLWADAPGGQVPLECMPPWPEARRAAGAGAGAGFFGVMLCKTFEAWCFAMTAVDPEDDRLVCHADLSHVRRALERLLSQASEKRIELSRLETPRLLASRTVTLQAEDQPPTSRKAKRAQEEEAANGEQKRTLQHIAMEYQCQDAERLLQRRPEWLASGRPARGPGAQRAPAAALRVA